jgi:hypothetical protein
VGSVADSPGTRLTALQCLGHCSRAAVLISRSPPAWQGLRRWVEHPLDVNAELLGEFVKIQFVKI